MQTKPTLWQKLNGSSVPRKCQAGEIAPGMKEAYYCSENAMFRTKKHDAKGSNDLTDYTYRCAEHTYL